MEYEKTQTAEATKEADAHRAVPINYKLQRAQVEACRCPPRMEEWCRESVFAIGFSEEVVLLMCLVALFRSDLMNDDDDDDDASLACPKHTRPRFHGELPY